MEYVQTERENLIKKSKPPIVENNLSVKESQPLIENVAMSENKPEAPAVTSTSAMMQNSIALEEK